MKTRLQIPNLPHDLRKIISNSRRAKRRGTEKNPDKRKERQVRKAQELPLLPLLSKQNDSIQVCKVRNTQLPTVLKETAKFA